jgi:hypothetical protein
MPFLSPLAKRLWGTAWVLVLIAVTNSILGVAMTLGLMFIYCAGNAGVFFYYRRERPTEFRFLLHFLLRLLSTISLLWVTLSSGVEVRKRFHILNARLRQRNR